MTCKAPKKNIFVNDRLKEIDSMLNQIKSKFVKVNLAYVPSQFNLADLVTKPCSAKVFLDKFSTWICGPYWLELPSDQWPKVQLGCIPHAYCDAPRTSEELPEPPSSPPMSTRRPAVQVNQFSWCCNAKTDKHFHDKRRKFVNSDKYSNRASFFHTQQASLVSQEHLQAVVRKVAKGEKFKGKKQQDFVVKTLPHSNVQKSMTSLPLSRQKAEGENRRSSVYIHRRKLVTDQTIPIYQYKTSMYAVKPSENRQEQKESQFKCPEVSLLRQTRDVMDDGITHVWRRENNVNRLIARKRYAASEHSSSNLKEDYNSSLAISKQFLAQLSFIFIMLINVVRSRLNMNLLKLLWVVGLAAVVCGSTGSVESAVAPPTVPVDSFGGKRFSAYILPSTNVYALIMNSCDKYIKNLESEYRTMRFYKLAYLYICAFDSS